MMPMGSCPARIGTPSHDAANSPESLLIGGPIQENVDKVATANPITYVTRDDPPFLIVHGTHDPLVSFNQSERLHKAFAENDIASTLIMVGTRLMWYRLLQ